MTMPWIKSPRCETCQHWQPGDDSGHALAGRCLHGQGIVGNVVKNMVTRNTAWCRYWKNESSELIGLANEKHHLSRSETERKEQTVSR